MEKFLGDKKEYGFQIHIASIWINLTDLNVQVSKLAMFCALDVTANHRKKYDPCSYIRPVGQLVGVTIPSPPFIPRLLLFLPRPHLTPSLVNLNLLYKLKYIHNIYSVLFLQCMLKSKQDNC